MFVHYIALARSTTELKHNSCVHVTHMPASNQLKCHGNKILSSLPTRLSQLCQSPGSRFQCPGELQIKISNLLCGMDMWDTHLRNEWSFWRLAYLFPFQTPPLPQYTGWKCINSMTFCLCWKSFFLRYTITITLPGARPWERSGGRPFFHDLWDQHGIYCSSLQHLRQHRHWVKSICNTTRISQDGRAV